MIRFVRWIGAILVTLLTVAALIGGARAEISEAYQVTRLPGGGGVLSTMTPSPTPARIGPPPGGGAAQVSTSPLSARPSWLPQLQLCGVGLAVLAGGGGLAWFVFFGKSRVELQRERQLDALRTKEIQDLDRKIVRQDQLNERLRLRNQWAQGWRLERMAELEAFDPEGNGGVLGVNARTVFDLAVDQLGGSANVRDLRRLAQHHRGIAYRFTEEFCRLARFTEANGWPILTCPYREKAGQPRDWHLIQEGAPKIPGYAARARWYFRPIPDELIEDMARYKHRCKRVLL